MSSQNSEEGLWGRIKDFGVPDVPSRTRRRVFFLDRRRECPRRNGRRSLAARTNPEINAPCTRFHRARVPVHPLYTGRVYPRVIRITRADGLSLSLSLLNTVANSNLSVSHVALYTQFPAGTRHNGCPLGNVDRSKEAIILLDLVEKILRHRRRIGRGQGKLSLAKISRVRSCNERGVHQSAIRARERKEEDRKKKKKKKENGKRKTTRLQRR